MQQLPDRSDPELQILYYIHLLLFWSLPGMHSIFHQMPILSYMLLLLWSYYLTHFYRLLHLLIPNLSVKRKLLFLLFCRHSQWSFYLCNHLLKQWSYFRHLWLIPYIYKVHQNMSLNNNYLFLLHHKLDIPCRSLQLYWSCCNNLKK